MAVAQEGRTAPDFRLLDKDGSEHRLSRLPAAATVLFFYPKDDTPGCTLEAKEFSAAVKRFTAMNVAVFGISGGDPKSKEKFCRKHNLGITLLADHDFAVAAAYGVYGLKKFMGREYKGINRTTFIIGPDRRVLKVFEEVKPAGHAAEVLEFLKGVVVKGSAAPAPIKTAAPRAKPSAGKRPTAKTAQTDKPGKTQTKRGETKTTSAKRKPARRR